jgi:hypothetical protein
LGIDEHKLSQLVAFALIRNRTIEAFVDFLSWVKQYLCAEAETYSPQHCHKLSSLIATMDILQLCDKYLQSRELCVARSIWLGIFAGHFGLSR